MTDYEKLKSVFDELRVPYIARLYANSIDICLKSSQETHFEFTLKDKKFIKITHY
jgi:hypothetical protein